MNEQSLRLTPLAAAIAAVLYPVQPALAQEYNDPVLEEVIVTAMLRETSLQVVPQSITAFTSEDILRNNLQSLDDLVNALPSLGLVNSQPGRNELIYRGVSSGTGEYYTDTQTAVYLNDSSISLISQQPFPHFVDLDWVESLPGPQGTLYGSASQTGTLRIITKKPNMDGVSGGAFAELGTTKGGDASYEVNGWVNVPIVDGLAIRAVGYYVKDGGWIDNIPHETYAGPTENGPQFVPNNHDIADDNINKRELTGGRISALWELSDDLSVTLAVISEDSHDDGTWNSDPALGDFKIVRFFEEYRDDTWTNVAFTVDADLGFAAFKSVTSIFDRDIKYEWDRMAYHQFAAGYWPYTYNGYDYNVLYDAEYTFGTTFNDQNQKRFSQEFRLTSQSESKFQWMIGAYYEDLHDDWYYGGNNPQLMETVSWPYAQYWAYYYNYFGYPVEYPMAPTTVNYSETLDRDIEQISIFGEVMYDITDKWRVIGGMRWFQYDRYNFLQNQFPEGLPPWGTMATDGITIGEGKTSDTLFKASVQYQISDSKMVYALYSQGFRLGGFNSIRSAATGLVPLEYGADTLDNFELGLKSQWADNRLLFNATLFFMQWSDYQQGYGDVDGNWWLRGTFNAADSETKGIEIVSTYLFTENVSADFSMFWADPEWSEDFIYPWQDVEDPDYDGPGIQKGDILPNSPKWKGRAALYWNIPGLFGTEEVFVNYDISFQGKSWNSIDNVRDQNENGILPSWNVSNLQIGTNLKNNWTVGLVIRNLFDQKAMQWLDTGGNYISDFFEADWNRDIRTWNRPRSFSIQVRKNWN
jgi:outer membrane receptor protein involved in Fe transport